MKSIATAGEVAMGNDRVPWVDLRTTDVQGSLTDALARPALKELIDRNPASPALRLIVLALPQPSDDLALTLAAQGIHLLTAALDVPAIQLLNRFQRHVQWNRTSRGGEPAVPAARRGPDDGNKETSESQRVFSQRPPWFDEQAWAERLRELQTPWSERDRSKWDY